jgi:glucose/arabinose dehydrogenase
MKARTTLTTIAILVIIIAAVGAAAVLTRGDTAKPPEAASIGPSPTMPAPTKTLIPTVEIAPAKGWADNAKPAAASGLAVTAFATGLDHPRWLYVLPNGDVLVAETNAPGDRPEDGKGIKGLAYRTVQKWAGAGVQSANRITLLRRENGVRFPAGNRATPDRKTGSPDPRPSTRSAS